MKWFRFLVLGLMLAAVYPSTALARTSGYTQTKYPIVLVHGALGWDSVMGIYDYWFLVAPELRAGGAKVYAANVSQLNSTEIRGEQLIRQLDTLRALYGDQKFNLLGHSHGGPTSRYVASVRPDLVASVTSVGSPHYGSATFDALLTPETVKLQKIASNLSQAISHAIALFSGRPFNPQDAVQSLLSISTKGSLEFNSKHPQGMPTTYCGNGPEVVNGIRYYSMGGTKVKTNLLDVSDLALAASALAFENGEANDGVIGRCSTHWGLVLRDDYPWNHMDEVNQILGLREPFSPSPPSVYRSHANRLKNLGL